MLVFSFAFVVSYLSSSHFSPVTESEAVSGTGTYYADISSSGSIDITLQSTPDGVYKVGKDSLSIDTNSTIGYKLYISTEDKSSSSLPSTTPANGLIDSATGAYISPSSGTVDTPVRLETNTWGYTVSRSSSSEVSTSYVDSDAAPTEAKGGKAVWRAVPEYGSEDIFYTNSSPATSSTNSVDVYYAVNASTALPSGAYSNTVVYTAIVEGNNPVTNVDEATIAPTSQSGLDAGETVTITTGIYSGFSVDNLGEIVVTIGGSACTDVTPSIDNTNKNLIITCTTPAQTSSGVYDVVVTLSKSGEVYKTYTIPEGYSYNRTFSLTYDYNSGSGAISPNPQTQTVAADSADFTIPNVAPTRTGYTFLGWSESQTATAATYVAGNTFILDHASHNDDSATLWAVWDWPTYTNLSTGCSATAVGNQYYYNSTAYIKLADNHCWTKESQGRATWNNASGLCSGKGSVPSAPQITNLLSYYGGSSNTSYPYGSPYGYVSTSAALYNITGWGNDYWTSTAYSNDYAWHFGVGGGGSATYYGGGKSVGLPIICIGA